MVYTTQELLSRYLPWPAIASYTRSIDIFKEFCSRSQVCSVSGIKWETDFSCSHLSTPLLNLLHTLEKKTCSSYTSALLSSGLLLNTDNSTIKGNMKIKPHLKNKQKNKQETKTTSIHHNQLLFVPNENDLEQLPNKEFERMIIK